MGLERAVATAHEPLCAPAAAPSRIVHLNRNVLSLDFEKVQSDPSSRRVLLLVVSDEGTARRSRRAAAGVGSEQQLDRVHGAERAGEVVQLGRVEALRELLHDERLGHGDGVERGVAVAAD